MASCSCSTSHFSLAYASLMFGSRSCSLSVKTLQVQQNNVPRQMKYASVSSVLQYHFPKLSKPAYIASVIVQLACMPENCGDMYRNLMMGSGGLPEGRLEGVGPRMEAGGPLEGRLISNDEVSMSHGCSKTGFRLPGLPACTSPEHMIWRGVFSLRSSSTEPGCFSKPDNSAWLTVSQRWWVRA